jgi:hypothetical protein
MYFFYQKTTQEEIMLFKKIKKLTVLQAAALLLVAAFAMVIVACPGDAIGGTEKKTPTAADYDISTNLLQTAGSVTAVTVTKKDETKSPGAVTVKYNNSTTVPQEVGNYTVTFDVAAATGWNEAKGLPAGTLVVNNLKTPVLDDYNITGTWEQIADSVTAINVTKKDDTRSPGAVTVKYNNSTTVPQTAGDYTVTFDVAPIAGSWNPATGLMAGTLIVDNPPKNFVSGADALNWGISSSASVLTLGLTPGKDTTEINLNWYSTGAPASKVAKVRFIRGTLAAGPELIEQEGAATAAGTSYTQHKATVTGLKPGRSYVYAVSSDGTNWSDTYDFKVPSATGAFKFAVIADPQLHNTTWDALNRYTPVTTGSKTAKGWLDTMAKIVANGVSFIASGGDQVDTSNNDTTAESEYPFFFAPEGLRSLPFAPVSGNHDASVTFNYHYNLPNVQNFDDESVGTEKGRNYFYLYNNILFVVLNTAPYPGSTSAAEPYVTRFKATIQAAKTANTGKYDWLIVQHHKSTASVADHLADKDIQYYVEAGFEKVMSDERVDFVLAGHDHVYARSWPLDGRDGGKVSVPDKTGGTNNNHEFANPGKPIYLTFTTGSGLKYYAVAPDPTAAYNNTLYEKNNASYPYLGEIAAGDTSTQFGSTAYLTKQYLPVSTAAYVQPYIPSYCIAEVNGKTIKFSTYPIVSASGTSTGATAPHNFTEDVAYDWVQVTKN